MAAKVKGLQEWCKRQCDGYRDVSITNMTSSWKSGLAFCAIIHKYRPDLIDYDSLSKEDVYENNKLAFSVGETIGIPALLDAEDMVAMAVPDKLCIITYVAQYYNVFRDKTPGGGPGKPYHATKRPSVGVPASRPPEIKRPSGGVPASRPAEIKRSPGGPPSRPAENKRPPPREIETQDETSGNPQKSNTALNRRGTYGENCHMCGGKVYLLERHIDSGTLYHRHCFRTSQKAQPKSSTYVSSLHPDSTKTQDNSRKTAGLFEAQNKNRVKYGQNYTPDGGIDKSLSAGLVTPSNPVSSQTRSHPYSRQPPTENKIDKIAELFKDSDKTPEKSNSSKNLLLAGYTSAAYKPISMGSSSVFSGSNGSASKSGSGLSTVSKVETKPHVTTITSKYASAHKAESDTKPTLSGPQGAGNYVTGSRLQKDKAFNDKTSEPSVVSGLLQNLAQVRNRETNVATPKSTVAHQPTSNTSVTGGKNSTNREVSHTTENIGDKLSQNVSKSTAISRSPNFRYLKIGTPKDSTKTSTDSQTSITKTLPSSKTEKTTVAQSNFESKNVKPYILSHDSNKTPTHSKIAREENRPNNNTVKETTSKQPKSILKTRKTEISKSDDELEIDWTTPDPSLKTNVQKTQVKNSVTQIRMEISPVAPPRKSILKKKNGLNHQQINSATNKVTSQSISTKNDLSAFNLNDSVEMSRGILGPVGPKNKKSEVHKVEIEIKGNEENGKPEWMVEAEKRQKMRAGKYNDPEKKTTVETSSDKVTDQNSNSHSSKTHSSDTKRTEISNGYANKKVNAKQIITGAINDKDKTATTDTKPDWMKEAERRQLQRKGQYIDPEKNPQRNYDVHDGPKSTSPPPPRPTHSPALSPTSRPKSPAMAFQTTPPRIPVSPPPSLPTAHVSPDQPKLQNQNSPTAGAISPREKKPGPRRPDHLPPYTTPPSYLSSTSPTRRVIPAKQPTSPVDSVEERRPLKKIQVDTDFEFSSFEASTDWDAVNLRNNSAGQRSPIYYPPERDSPVPPPVPPKNFGEEELSPYSQRVKEIQERPLPTPPLRSPGCDGCGAAKRTVQAEDRLSLDDMATQLEELDKQLQILEGEGRILEDKIRSVETSEETNDDDMMVEWFELVNAKNDLVRKEADLMYLQRQQELEVLHEELEYDLRCLMNKPEHKKTASEKIREAALLEELLDTVSQRNLIVDSMEEDRIRYIEEDEVIANMMATKVFAKESPKAKNAKRKKNKKEKKKKS